ncbi:alpha/beta hydrolase fold-1 [Trichococcus palustris]|jgi:pimeloyl-ACP methyl ester carboxylesterase|uniref:Maspardin n=1 Tax=Trichococcus palustris TaxID=140314 RepID=A0A143YV49_9LACT|nr:alpha/beta hydrolase [Trichococcus palustris]CZQ99585.1 alpha/beta hydrolase fold-1 [Trichococcus palustris]SFK87340.1 alpha/beta hydrolase fold [Trichococcus palustris]
MYSKEEALGFERKYGKKLKIGSIVWQYYKLGNAGTVLLFLTGGLRRARFGYAILEKLSAEHTVLALDYPPVESIGDFIDAIDGLLASENIKKVILIGQSYGGIIAQAYMLYRPEKLSRLILSNSGPLQFSFVSRFELNLALKVVDILSEKNAKKLFCKMILLVFPK